MEWIPAKYNNFLGIQKDTRKTQIGSFEEVLNLDIRDKTGDLNLRNGYDIKYDAIPSATLTAKYLSNVEYLKVVSFWVDDHDGQEITVQFTKQRVAAVTTLTPNYFDMLGVWIRPYWNGSSWADEWHWLNEIIITKISSIVGSSQLNLYLQAETTDDDLFKNWSILHYSGTDYTDPDEISMIYSSEDDSTQNVKIMDSSHAWVANDKIILMKNYFPPAVLNALHSDISASDIVTHKVLDDLRVGFGGQENRLGMSIGFRNRVIGVVDPDLAEINFNDLFLDPYNTISDFDDTFDLTITETSQSPGFTAAIYYKVVAVLDGFQRFEVLSGTHTPSIECRLGFAIKALFGTFNKRLTGFEVYFSENSETSPYYLVDSTTIAADSYSATANRDGNGYLLTTNNIVFSDFEDATEELLDVLGYSLPAEYLRSWDKAVNIDGKTYLLNGYSDKRYESLIFYSEVSGASANMPDVIANSYHDINEFDGDTGLGLLESPNGYLGIWSDNKFQMINPITGIPIGFGVIFKGAVSKDSIVNLGQELIWASEYDITKNRGYQIYDVSEGSIRGDYRAISDKSSIIAVREEKGNCYRFFDGSTYEYILTERGWIRWSVYNKPTNYIVRKDGEVWFMKNGVIYYPTGYQDRASSSNYSSIPFKLKSMPVDIRLLDSSIKFTNRFYAHSSIKFTNRFYAHAFHIQSSEMPIGATLKIYLDGVLYSTKTITGLSDIFYRIPQGASCKQFQFELSGNGYEALSIYDIELLWKPIKVGAVHGRAN